MGIGDLDSGKRFGLPPIGLPEATLETGRSDTERRAFPGLATKSSVFAWKSPLVTLYSVSLTSGTATVTINLRANTAAGGSSVDVPTWAAGCLVGVSFVPGTLGTSTDFSWTASSPAVSGIGLIAAASFPTTTTNDIRQVIVPFYDEPSFVFNRNTNGSGTYSVSVSLQGFVRNV